MKSNNPKILNWTGKRVWLVGASSGIGAALARALAARGARLALSARRLEALQGLGIDGALLLPCDVLDTEALAAARTRLVAAWDGVDLVVYLAGDYEPMSADGFNAARAERIVAVNFTGALRLAGAVLGDLQPGGGIAFVASVAGYRGLPKALAYGPGKAALIQAGYWQGVMAFVAAIEDDTQRALAEVALNDTQEWRRDSPFLNAAAAALGLSTEQLDALIHALRAKGYTVSQVELD